jgi:hypothetical protein
MNADGYQRTSPVTAFPPKDYGVPDVIGSVHPMRRRPVAIPSYDPCRPNIRIPRKVNVTSAGPHGLEDAVRRDGTLPMAPLPSFRSRQHTAKSEMAGRSIDRPDRPRLRPIAAATNGVLALDHQIQARQGFMVESVLQANRQRLDLDADLRPRREARTCHPDSTMSADGAGRKWLADG